MKKLLLAAAVAVAVIIPINGQSIEIFDETLGTHTPVTAVSPYLMTPRFVDNTFASAAIGFNVYVGDGDGKGSGKRVGNAWELSYGKWTTPFLGHRLQVVNMTAKGWSDRPAYYTEQHPGPDGLYHEKFHVFNFRGDMLFDIMNLIEGYRESRLWTYVPFFGFGIGHSSGNGNKVTELNLNVGLLNNIRITDRLDGTVEARYMMMKSRFDGVEGKRKIDGIFTLTFGISYRFGERGFRRPVQLLR